MQNQGFNFNNKFVKVGQQAQQESTPQANNNGSGNDIFNDEDNGIFSNAQLQQPQQQVVQPQPQVKPRKVAQQPRQPQMQPMMTIGGAISDAAVREQAEGVVATVLQAIKNDNIKVPEGYNASNQLMLAYYKILSLDGILMCDPASIVNALLETAIQGLSVSQTQCYYIKYGNKVVVQRAYFGDIALLKRTRLVKDVYARVIYEGDEIEQETDEYGLECITKHNSKFGNQDGNILGAYAVAVGTNGYKRYCIMTMRQIQNNFKLSKSYGDKNKLQTDFIEEGCKRTAIRRLVKMILNTAVDLNEYQNQIIGSYNRTTEDEFIDKNDDIKYGSTENIKDALYYGTAEVVKDDM